jgi:hypothetical protein
MGKYTEQIKAFEAVEPEVTSQTAPKSKYADEIAKAEGLNPQGSEQVKNAAIEGTGGPSIQRTMSGVEMGPLGISFNPIKYKAANPNTDTWDMVGDILTSATTVIPGGTMAKTAVKTGIQTVAGAGTGALLTALGGTEKLAAAAQKYPVLKPIMLLIQAGGAGMSLQNPKITPLSKEGQAAVESGVPFTQSAEAKVQGAPQTLIDREYLIKQKYPEIYEKEIQQPRQAALKANLESIGGEAATMTGESAGASIKSNVEAKQKAIGREFGQVETAIKEMENEIMSGENKQRGIGENLYHENDMALSYGKGLYTAALSYKPLAKQYGTVYAVVGGVPKKPKQFQNLNSSQIFRQHYGDDAEVMKKALIEEGYDGLEIKGREMVNYNPPKDLKFFKTEKQLKDYFDTINSPLSYREWRKKNVSYRGLKEPEAINPVVFDNVSSKIDGYLKSQKVGDTLTGNEAIKSTDVINLIRERSALLKNAKSTEDLLNQKRQFGEEIKKAFVEKGSKDNNAKKAVYKIIDDAIYESIPDKKLADEWRGVNDKWSELQDNLFKVEGGSEAGRIANTEANKLFGNKVLSKGPEAINALKELAGEQAVKDAGMQYLFYEGTKEGRVNVDKIASKLTELKNKGMAQKIFGADLEKLDKFVEVGKFVESPMAPHPGQAKYGNSQTAFVLEMTKNMDTPNWSKNLKLFKNAFDRWSAALYLKQKDVRLKGTGTPGLVGSGIAGASRGILLERKGKKMEFKSLNERKAKK